MKTHYYELILVVKKWEYEKLVSAMAKLCVEIIHSWQTKFYTFLLCCSAVENLFSLRGKQRRRRFLNSKFAITQKKGSCINYHKHLKATAICNVRRHTRNILCVLTWGRLSCTCLLIIHMRCVLGIWILECCAISCKSKRKEKFFGNTIFSHFHLGILEAL